MSSLCVWLTEWSTLDSILHDNFCANDVDLRKLHKWFLRHPWKRHLNHDDSSLDVNLGQFIFASKYNYIHETLYLLFVLLKLVSASKLSSRD